MLKSIIKSIKKVFSGPRLWTCPRCGTVNNMADSICKYCKNRRPY